MTTNNQNPMNQEPRKNPTSDELVLDKIQNYLETGGVFNPELMNHELVRDMIMECRDEIKHLRGIVNCEKVLKSQLIRENEELKRKMDVVWLMLREIEKSNGWGEALICLRQAKESFEQLSTKTEAAK